MFHPWNTCPGSDTVHKGASMNAPRLFSRNPVSYGSISGEKEKGTLKLACSNRLMRHEFLLGKFLAGASGLSAVVLVVWLVSILLVTKESSVLSETGIEGMAE